MNNLILAVIAITFSALIMTAGISYLTPTHAILNTEATDSTIEIDQMLADYNSLKMNVGSDRPSASDYLTVYGEDKLGNIHTQNGTYQNIGTSDAPNLTRKSFLNSIPDVQNATSGWVFIKGCNGAKDASGNAIDCFQLTVDNTKMLNPVDAQTTCEALALAQKRMAGTSMAMNIQNSDGSPHNCN